MRHSIRYQFMMGFTGALVLVILLCMLSNELLLEPFYVREKREDLKEAYELINEYASRDSLDSDEFDVGFDLVSSKYGLDIILMDSDAKTFKVSVDDSTVLSDRLFKYLFVGPSKKDILDSNDNYTVQRSVDPRMKTEFIELWGTLSDTKLVFMRTPVESIRESVSISNRFLSYVGIIGLILGLLLNLFLSRKVTAPILELVSISERMTKFDFDIKYKSGGKNEIALLGEHMNALSTTLEEAINELKTANNELKSDLAKKTEIDEMRKEFLSNVSHELKTPIALIQGYSEGLKDCVNADQESRDYYCDVIIDEAAKMNTLVKSLLELNQLEFGNDNISIERVNIVEMVHNCIQSIQILLEQNNITLEYIHESDDIYVWTDVFKIEHVLNNYLSNAIHYCMGEKRIVVEIVEKDETVRVSVFNTGEPIPEESIPHLWTKFYKVDKARTREYGGSGIGLSIVKAVMDSLNRGYGVINHEDGVEFWFELDGKPEV